MIALGLRGGVSGRSKEEWPGTSEGVWQEEEREMKKKEPLSILSLSLALGPSMAFKLRGTYRRAVFALSKTGQGELRGFPKNEILIIHH